MAFLLDGRRPRPKSLLLRPSVREWLLPMVLLSGVVDAVLSWAGSARWLFRLLEGNEDHSGGGVFFPKRGISNDIDV